MGLVATVAMALLIGGLVAMIVGALLMDSAPDWLMAVLLIGGRTCATAGVFTGVAVLAVLTFRQLT